MARSDYKAQIIESFRKPDKKKDLYIRQTQGEIKLQEAMKDTSKLIIEGPTNLHRLAVHNEFSKENTDYEVYVLETADTSYGTGSSSFYESCMEVLETFEEEINTGEIINLIVRVVPSKNNKGGFYTVTVE